MNEVSPITEYNVAKYRAFIKTLLRQMVRWHNEERQPTTQEIDNNLQLAKDAFNIATSARVRRKK